VCGGTSFTSNDRFSLFEHTCPHTGYMSPDFCNHVVAMFAEPLLKYRNRDLYHVTCFHSSSKTDSQTERLQTLADEWVGVADKNTSEIASAIRQRSIDILVELSGLTAGCRMDVMVQKPAPVQCTCIGYPNTTGIAEIDYRITDAIADPPDTEQQFVETLLRLPKCFLCFTPPTQVCSLRSMCLVCPLPKTDRHERTAVAQCRRPAVLQEQVC